MGNKLVEGLSAMTASVLQATPDILELQFTVVNAFIVSEGNKWVLVDTGLENSGDFILECAEKKFGKGSRPQAIILTHGHFDHVGSVARLSEQWDVPVYIHKLELPYITGKKDYPLADPTVDEGMVAKMSESFPHRSIHLGYRAVELPSGGSVPGLTEWRWIHTPGHTEGHVCLFRERDRVLIAADAFSTVKQELLMDVISQREQISGPPKYLTTDWAAAEKSVKLLADLKPSLALPSHGQPMEGEELGKHLELLTNNFTDIAKPRQGKFVSTH